MDPDFTFFYISIFSYVVFLIFTIVKKIGNVKSPMGRFNQIHLKFSSFYLLNSFLFLFFFGEFKLTEILQICIGLFCYFLIHYAFVLNFFALAQRSISSSILKLLYENGDLNLEQLDQKYALGEGFKHIQVSRLEDMEKLKWIKRDAGNIILLNSGQSTQKFVAFILKIIGLKQIGEE
ncbi:hypothetical protein EHQ79_15540 [Leptospira jelokensis]|nr:hypothetical protein EHQ79_15540 [Leptospira jelokensis]